MRKLSREEFVARMLDAQERRKAISYKLRDDIYAYFKARDLKMKKRQHRNNASLYHKRTGKR